MAEKTWSSVMAEQFRREGQKPSDFMAEIRALTFEDRQWYAAELRKAGIECPDPVQLTAK